MPISFQCTCGKKIQAPDAAAGKSGKCPGCGQTITIPQPAAAVAVQAPAVNSPAPAPAPLQVPAAGAGVEHGPLRAAAVRREEKEIKFSFQGVYPMAVATALQEFFTSQGYRLESGEKMGGTYGTGSDVLRILLGGFVKRYKFDFTIELHEPNVLLTLTKGMSGAMGGALGYAKMKKEMARIFDALTARFTG